MSRLNGIRPLQNRNVETKSMSLFLVKCYLSRTIFKEYICESHALLAKKHHDISTKSYPTLLKFRIYSLWNVHAAHNIYESFHWNLKKGEKIGMIANPRMNKDHRSKLEIRFTFINSVKAWLCEKSPIRLLNWENVAVLEWNSH